MFHAVRRGAWKAAAAGFDHAKSSFGGPDGPGFGPFGPGFGGAGWGGGPYGRGRGHRHHRRGRDRRNFDLRAAILTLLAEEPLHGYELMRRISERSGGAWRPSPGSIYPALAKLRDEGLVLISEEDGRKTARLTEAGQAHVEEFREELGEVWTGVDPGEDDPMVGFWTEARQLMMAARQIVQTGDPAQLEKATAVIAAARRKLYGVLAEEEPERPQAPGRPDAGWGCAAPGRRRRPRRPGFRGASHIVNIDISTI
jgi:DNA-binding PadR family transcriptional regulator